MLIDLGAYHMTHPLAVGEASLGTYDPGLSWEKCTEESRDYCWKNGKWVPLQQNKQKKNHYYLIQIFDQFWEIICALD